MTSPATQLLADYFANKADEVSAVYLFGSHATGKFRADSDVDVAVLLRTAPPKTFAGLHLGLAGELERLLSLPVDLVVLNDAPVDLVRRVLQGGTLVADIDRQARIAFEVKARNEYFDLLPYLEEYRHPKKVSA
ncbi:MAG: nucleotidyltransferase domain-containing protein [Deltaproteobacteria bacterium]|nr:nucleotidyltransferase domain-containing protein [Deltaproteobacteria bacterium]